MQLMNANSMTGKKNLYTSLGFRLLPELDGDDLVFGL